MAYFSSLTQRALEAHGWREERHIDTSEYERVLRAAGYADCQMPCAFLQRYGDLALLVAPDSTETYLDTCLPQILQTMQAVPVSLFSQEVGRTLYFIGSCWYDFHTLLMDSEGRVYRTEGGVKPDVFGIGLFLIAASGEEAMEKLVHEEQREVALRGEWVAQGEWAAHFDGTRYVRSRVNPNYS